MVIASQSQAPMPMMRPSAPPHSQTAPRHNPWVTAAETAECALAYLAVGETDTAAELLNWTRAHRLPDGAYLTGIVYPSRVSFPDEERTAYTGAAIILAADAMSGATPASGLFVPAPALADDPEP